MNNLENSSIDQSLSPPFSQTKENRGNHFSRVESISKTSRYTSLDDYSIWEEFKKGDEAAFIHIYIKFFSELLNFGLQFTRDKTLIEDIIQNLFIHLRNKRPVLPKLRASIRLYLFQSLKRKIFDYQKTNKHIWAKIGLSDNAFEIVLDEESRMIDDQNHQEKIGKLKRSIEKLNVKQREIIYYFYYKELPYEEIKILMGFNNVKSARNLVYKTINQLRRLIISLAFFVTLI